MTNSEVFLNDGFVEMVLKSGKILVCTQDVAEIPAKKMNQLKQASPEILAVYSVNTQTVEFINKSDIKRIEKL